MRIGLVCPYSFDAHGGVQNHVLELAEALTAAGHVARVLGPGEQGDHLPEHVTATGRAVPVPFNGSVARVSFGPLVAGRVRRWLEEGRFDVLHLHEPNTPSVAALALWSARVPVVATYHTAQERPWALSASAATVLRGGLDKIARHVAVSDEAAATLRRYQDVEPIVIPNGIRASRFGPRAAAERRTVVFLGRVDEPRKGLPLLLEALPAVLSRHPDVDLLVLGAGDPTAVARLRRGLPLDVRDRVVFLGAVDDVTKAQTLRSAAAYVAPHLGGESFGIVLAEALASEVPVVAADLPAFVDVLGGGRDGVLFPAGDVAALAGALDATLTDPPSAAELARRAQSAHERFDWSRVMPRVLAVYRGALGDSSAAAARAAV